MAVTATCRGCATHPMRASRSATSSGCAPAWPGATRTTHERTPAACNKPWRASGRAPSWNFCAPCRARSRKAPSSITRPSRAACSARWSPLPQARRWPRIAPGRSGGRPAWRPTATGRWRPRTGLELGGAGVSARLRDLGRFGQFVLEDGEAFNGRRVLPPGWRDLAGQPDSPPTAFGRLIPGSAAGYGYQWWALPHVPTGIHAGAFTAIGACGQYVYVNPAEQVVIVIQSAWRQNQDSDAEVETFRLFGAVVRALRPDR
ncbi:MAG: serine hydrolase [Proteobacteria bacterium]|nr:serine hydrolase [Pseudomonadota bacterium]